MSFDQKPEVRIMDRVTYASAILDKGEEIILAYEDYLLDKITSKALAVKMKEFRGLIGERDKYTL